MTDKELEEKRADAKRRWELFKQHKREALDRLEKINQTISNIIDKQVEIRSNYKAL